MNRLMWTRDSLIEALNKLPENVSIMLDGCGCCAREDAQGITYRKANVADDMPAYAVLRRNHLVEEDN